MAKEISADFPAYVKSRATAIASAHGLATARRQSWLVNKKLAPINKLILESLPNVDLKKYNDLIKTWLEILADFDNKEVNLLIKLYLEGLEKKPEVIRILEPSIHNCLRNFTKDQIERLRDCFSETLFLVPFYKKNLILENLSEESLNWLVINNEAIKKGYR